MEGFAIIDIGSNSIRYMGRGKKELVTTRLAAGLDQSGALSMAAVGRSIAAIAGFAGKARNEGLVPRAYATSAVREAKNGEEFTGLVSRECGVSVDVLTGQREARYAWLGATGGSGGLVDIGGGSSQLIAEGFSQSFPMGCVRAAEAARSVRAESAQALYAALSERFSGIYRFPRIYIRDWTGVGGTVTTLAALKKGLAQYDPDEVTGAGLTRDDVICLADKLYSMGEKRAEHPLLRDRHDVIVPGALILRHIMEGMGIETVTVSDRDGMEGYRMYLTEGR